MKIASDASELQQNGFVLSGAETCTNLNQPGKSLLHHFLVTQGKGAQHQVEGGLCIKLSVHHTAQRLHCILQQLPHVVTTCCDATAGIPDW